MPKIRKRFSIERNEHVNSYYTKVQPRLEEVTLMRMDYMSLSQIARELGVSPSAFIRWSKKYQELADALEEGNIIFEEKAMNSLLKSAFGYFYTEEKNIEKIDPEGGMTVIKEKHRKWKPANPMLLMNILKSLNEKWTNLQGQNKDIQIELDDVLKEYAE